MTTRKQNYLKQAQDLSRVMHNQLVFMNAGIEMTLPGADDDFTKKFVKANFDRLLELLKSAHDQGDNMPDYLPMQKGMKLDIRPWKESLDS